jgi:hypothetical protein
LSGKKKKKQDEEDEEDKIDSDWMVDSDCEEEKKHKKASSR